MKSNFTQPFIQADTTTAHLIVEAGTDSFLHFIYEDELGARFANLLKLEIDENEDVTGQLAKFLYSHGLAINSHRELAQRTQVAFSFADDTAGSCKKQICLHVTADRVDVPIPSDLGNPTFESLDIVLRNLQESPRYMDGAAELGIARILNERSSLPTRPTSKK